MRDRLMCPQCGWTYSSRHPAKLVPKHRDGRGDDLFCPGTEQVPRSEHDRRPLWGEGGVA